MVHVSNIVWRIKNQPSNYTSCSDNPLRLLVLVACKLHWGLQVTSSFWICGCILKGCFLERYILKGQVVFEWHWRPQSWTLLSSLLSPFTNMALVQLEGKCYMWLYMAKICGCYLVCLSCSPTSTKHMEVTPLSSWTPRARQVCYPYIIWHR